MLKELLSKNYNVVSRILHRTEAEKWEENAVQAALETVKISLNKVPAYKEFLKESKHTGELPTTMEEFTKLPISDKYNFFKKYPLEKTSLAIPGESLYSFSLSSGTTDIPTLWPRYIEQENSYPMVAELFGRLYWDIKNKKTLLINAFNMGVYASGFSINAGLRPLTSKYGATLATTGSEIENIIYTIKLLHKYYDQVAIFSYPTFLRTILDKIEEAGIDVKKLNLKFFLTGEAHTVEWQSYMCEILTGDANNLSSIVDIYSSTETGFVGMGTPLCNLIRRLCLQDKELCNAIFGEVSSIPNIVQYNTSNQYIETVDGNLVITSKNGTPLVRYNIHDRGGTVKFRDMETILEKHGYDYKKMLLDSNILEEAIWQLPFVYCYGRGEDVVIIGGGNVFPEQIEPLLINDEEQLVNSFKMKMITNETFHQYFHIYLELKSTVQIDKSEKLKLQKRYHDIIFNYLMKNNSDYAIAYKSDPENSDPIIEVSDFRTGLFCEDSKKTKPKLVLK